VSPRRGFGRSIGRYRIRPADVTKGAMVEPDIIFLLVIAAFFFAGMGFLALKGRNRGS
jgi:hypothetical protein